MSRPSVSILIPVYNREEMIVDAIESALIQTFQDIEVIVVDNCSTDNTYVIAMEIAQGDERLRVYRNDENIGPVLNWKRCLQYATADYVKILYSDDWIDRRFIEKTFSILTEIPEAGFVYTSTVIHHGESTSLLYSLENSGLYDLKKFIEGQIFGGNYPVSPGCALFRKRDVQNNLLINISNEFGLNFKDFGAGNDLLLYLLCSRGYNRFYFLAEPLAHFRDHGGSFTMSRDLSLYYLISKKHYFDHHADPAYKDLFYYSLHRANRKKGGEYTDVLRGADYRKDPFFALKFWFLRKMARMSNPVSGKG